MEVLIFLGSQLLLLLLLLNHFFSAMIYHIELCKDFLCYSWPRASPDPIYLECVSHFAVKVGKQNPQCKCSEMLWRQASRDTHSRVTWYHATAGAVLFFCIHTRLVIHLTWWCTLSFHSAIWYRGRGTLFLEPRAVVQKLWTQNPESDADCNWAAKISTRLQKRQLLHQFASNLHTFLNDLMQKNSHCAHLTMKLHFLGNSICWSASFIVHDFSPIHLPSVKYDMLKRGSKYAQNQTWTALCFSMPANGTPDKEKIIVVLLVQIQLPPARQLKIVQRRPRKQKHLTKGDQTLIYT